MYILKRDMDTISLLVEPLRDDGEYMLALLDPCLAEEGRRGGWCRSCLRQLCKNKERFRHQLDELGEHPSSASGPSTRT
jgi:hypothetical protein